MSSSDHSFFSYVYCAKATRSSRLKSLMFIFLFSPPMLWQGCLTAWCKWRKWCNFGEVS
jgi:hypothetical protein